MEPVPEWEKKEKFMIRSFIFCISLICLLIASFIILFLFSCCTLSFQNISTHGTATDLVDEHQTASPKTDANIPISLTPK